MAAAPGIQGTVIEMGGPEAAGSAEDAVALADRCIAALSEPAARAAAEDAFMAARG
ncbi:hypothetical protein [Phenylobacterium sp.]|jgi:hypothetical protein|uniref:hypothetical protein n=1 Tax=Phenylobacterium sp. TaxID=1871053 RepID=UPI002F41FD65